MKSLLAALMLVGCSSQPAGVTPVVRPLHPSGPPRPTTRGDLLYVVGSYGKTTYILSYPSLRLVGKLKERATGICSDTQGNVYVTTWSTVPPSGAILKYAHGETKPALTLADGFRPVGCAVDPKTGNLAATDLGTPSGRETNVAIWRKGKGVPTLWADPSIQFFSFCGFDDHDNLFVDGYDKANNFQFAEMPKNGTFQNVSLNQQIEAAGSVQWDGKYVAIADAKEHEIYRFEIAGFKGTLEGSTTLTGWQTTRLTQTWIAGSTVVAPYGSGQANEVGVWNYPSGGVPAQTKGGILPRGWVQSLTVSVSSP